MAFKVSCSTCRHGGQTAQACSDERHCVPILDNAHPGWVGKWLDPGKLWKQEDWTFGVEHEHITLCPVCAEICVHLSEIEVKREDRGTKITVYYWCESGHYWAVHQQFHKGQVFVSVEALPEFDGDSCPTELWRN